MLSSSLTGVTGLLGISLQVTSPHVLWFSSLSLPLGIPDQSLTGDAGFWFPKSLGDPTPSSLSCFFFHWLLVCSLPKLFVADGFRPIDLEESS